MLFVIMEMVMSLKFLNGMRSSPVMQNLSANLCHLTETAGLFTAVLPGEMSFAVGVHISSVCTCIFAPRCVTTMLLHVSVQYNLYKLLSSSGSSSSDSSSSSGSSSGSGSGGGGGSGSSSSRGKL
jgi:uncharacterized membrane protein YgcG